MQSDNLINKFLNKLSHQVNLFYLNDIYRLNKNATHNCNNKPLKEPNIIDIVTIAFNNEKVIIQQIRLLQKFLTDPFFYTVVDNSSDPIKQLLIEKICKNQGIGYIKLPPNPYNGIDPSMSHGLALNLVYEKYIKRRGAKYFGFIDHDIFPIKTTSIIPKLKEGIYGLKQKRGEIWYLWPGFSFFEGYLLKDKKVNFLPTPGADTGSGNYRDIYSSINEEDIPTLEIEYQNLRDGNDMQSDLYWIIGDWIHTINASYWKQVDDKENLVEKLLDRY